MKMNVDEFDTRLRTTREQRRLSQAALAERMGLPPSSISHFESGKRRPSFENIVGLCLALNVSADYLLGIEEKEIPQKGLEALGKEVSAFVIDAVARMERAQSPQRMFPPFYPGV